MGKKQYSIYYNIPKRVDVLGHTADDALEEARIEVPLNGEVFGISGESHHYTVEDDEITGKEPLTDDECGAE